jgi:hypothetical protein
MGLLPSLRFLASLNDESEILIMDECLRVSGAQVQNWYAPIRLTHTNASLVLLTAKAKRPAMSSGATAGSIRWLNLCTPRMGVN